MLSAFLVLVAFVAAARLVELGISRRHRRELRRLGARAVGEPGFAAMVAVHAGILGGSVVEALVLDRSAPVAFGAVALSVVLAANVLRIVSIRSLGRHWNVKVVDSTTLGVVGSGPYRFVRHPNYVAVFLELLFLPLVQGAWITAVLGTVAHVLVLRRRIALEESVLLADPRYVAVMGGKPRFVPRLSRRRSRVVGAGEA